MNKPVAVFDMEPTVGRIQQLFAEAIVSHRSG